MVLVSGSVYRLCRTGVEAEQRRRVTQEVVGIDNSLMPPVEQYMHKKVMGRKLPRATKLWIFRDLWGLYGRCWRRDWGDCW